MSGPDDPYQQQGKPSPAPDHTQQPKGPYGWQIAAVTVGVLIGVVLIGVVGMRGFGIEPFPTSRMTGSPTTLAIRQADGSIVIAQPGVTSPILEVFEDFQCPGCKKFEATSGPAIEALTLKGKVRVVYRPIDLFTGREPLGSNSHRAAAAALCLPAGNWLLFHRQLFRNQPAQGSDGFPIDQLVTLEQQAGISDPAVDDCVTRQLKSSQVDQMTSYATGQRGVSATPTIFLNSKQLDQNTLMDPHALQQAIMTLR